MEQPSAQPTHSSQAPRQMFQACTGKLLLTQFYNAWYEKALEKACMHGFLIKEEVSFDNGKRRDR